MILIIIIIIIIIMNPRIVKKNLPLPLPLQQPLPLPLPPARPPSCRPWCHRFWRYLSASTITRAFPNRPRSSHRAADAASAAAATVAVAVAAEVCQLPISFRGKCRPRCLRALRNDNLPSSLRVIIPISLSLSPRLFLSTSLNVVERV